jgi:hypothetical protein
MNKGTFEAIGAFVGAALRGRPLFKTSLYFAKGPATEGRSDKCTFNVE